MRNQIEFAEFSFSLVKDPSDVANLLPLTLISTKLHIFIWNIYVQFLQL